MTAGCPEKAQQKKGTCHRSLLPIAVSLLQRGGCREPGEVGTSPVLLAPGGTFRRGGSGWALLAASQLPARVLAGRTGRRSSTAAQSADCAGNGTAAAAGQGWGRKWVAPCPRTELLLAGLGAAAAPRCQPWSRRGSCAAASRPGAALALPAAPGSWAGRFWVLN